MVFVGALGSRSYDFLGALCQVYGDGHSPWTIVQKNGHFCGHGQIIMARSP